MLKEHSHQWRGLKTDTRILECSVPGCDTVVKISDLIERVEQRGIEIGRYQICDQLLNPTAMLTPRGRKAIRQYLQRHPLTRYNSVKHRQARLII